MKISRILCTLLAATMALSVASCKRETRERVEIEIDTEDEYIKHILIEDYEGYNFRILNRKGATKQQLVEEETGNIIDDAVFKRN